MLESGPAVQAQALDEAKALGADVIRANVIWSRFAPSPTSKKKPKGFDGKNPAAYPAGAFDMLDAFVAGAQARGMQVLLTPTGPIPAWASRCGGSRGQPPRLQARSAAVRRVRARARHALPDRQAVVDLERAEPALVADARSTRSSARRPCSARANLYRALATSAIAGLRGTGHRDRPDLARRDRAAGRRPVRLQRPALAARAQEAARARSSRPRRRRSCAASSA